MNENEEKEEINTEAQKPLENNADAENQPEEKEEIKKDDISGTYNGVAQTLDNTYFNPIRYIYDKTIAIDDDIEKSRDRFAKKIKKGKIVDRLSVAMMLIAFVGVILVTLLNKGDNKIDWLTYVVLGVAIAIIIASFILTTVINKKTGKDTKEYLNEYEDMLNGYVISDLNVENPTLCIDAKINDQDIIQAHYFHTINKIESRAVVEGTRYGKHFSLGEVAVIIPTISLNKANEKPVDMVNLDGSLYIKEPVTDTMTGTQEVATAKDMTVVDLDLSNEVMNEGESKKREKDLKKSAQGQQTDTATGLFGKIYSYDMKIESDQAFIIAFMGLRNATVLPTNLTGFKAVKVPSLRNDIVVYCTEPQKAAGFFDEEACRILNSITPNQVVQSLFISVNSYGSKIGMTLSDDIMQLPIKQLEHLGSYESYKDCTDKSFAYIDYVAKKAGK